MTSSNGEDWFPKTPEDSGKTRRIDANIPERLYTQLEEQAAIAFRTIPGQLCFVLDKHFLNGCQQADLLLSARRSAEGGEFPEKGNNARSASTLPKIDLPITGHGVDGVGGESENPPRKKGTKQWQKVLPPCLEEFRQQILDFWAEKKGSKSERAWNLLTKELSAIHAHLNVGRAPKGRETFLEQLELATANRFQSITLKNYKLFAETQQAGKKFEKPFERHPQQLRKGRLSPEDQALIDSGW